MWAARPLDLLRRFLDAGLVAPSVLGMLVTLAVSNGYAMLHSIYCTAAGCAVGVLHLYSICCGLAMLGAWLPSLLILGADLLGAGVVPV